MNLSTYLRQLIYIASIPLLFLFVHFARANNNPAGVTNTQLLTQSSSGIPANDSSFFPHPSQDGRYITFISWAGDEWFPDQTDGNNFKDVFVRDTLNGTTKKISWGTNGATNHESLDPTLSADGRFIAYSSFADNIVPGDNNSWFEDRGLDVFLFDQWSGQTSRVSVNWRGDEINDDSFGTITGNGQYIIFASKGSNVTVNSVPEGYNGLYIRDWQTGSIEVLARPYADQWPNGWFDSVWGSYDGRYIAFSTSATNLIPNDNNNGNDIFLFDRATDTLTLVSRSLSGTPGNGASGQPYMSSDGGHIVFRSWADDLIPGDNNATSDVFLYTAATDTLQRISVSESGVEGNGISSDPSVCDNGQIVSFTSASNNLVPGDVNGERDIFLYDTIQNSMTVASINNSGAWGNGRAHKSFLSADCSILAHASDATNLVANDTNNARDLFTAEVVTPANITGSTLTAPLTANPSEEITYVVTLRNSGDLAGDITLTAPIPAGTTYVPTSTTGGITHNNTLNQMEWTGTLAGNGQTTLTYRALISPTANWTTIPNTITLQLGSLTTTHTATTIINGATFIHLPIASQP